MLRSTLGVDGYTVDMDGALASYARDAAGNVNGLKDGSNEIKSISVRDTPVRIALYGDSTANVGTTSSPDNQDCSIVTAPFPASGLTNIGGTGNANATALSIVYPQAYIVANCGLNGAKAADMLARESAGYSVTRKSIADMINLRPDIVIVRGISVNDYNVNAGNWESTVAANVITVKEILSIISTGAEHVLYEGILGFSAPSGYTDPNYARLAILRHNAEMKAFINTSLVGRVTYVDPLIVGLQEVDGNIKTGLSNDGLHLNTAGGFILANYEAAVFTRLFGVSRTNRYVGVNLITNALMHSASATTATGFSSFVNAGSAVNSVELLEGKKWQVVTVTPSGSGNFVQLNIPFDPTAMGIAVNDVYGAEFEWFVEPVTNPSITSTSIYARMDIYKSAAGRVLNDANFGGGGVFTGKTKGKAVFMPFKFQEASAALTTSSKWSLYFHTSELTGVYRVAISEPRFVKLNQPMYTT